jgi:adsorption protein B
VTPLLDGLQVAQHELLLFSAFWFLVGALDDLCIDLLWFAHRCWSWIKGSDTKNAGAVTEDDDRSLLAVFIPAWAEQAVIGAMLRHCLSAWADSPRRFRIYVGYYPNDCDSAARIGEVAHMAHQIRTVMLPHEGPTTKADCLNHLWDALLADERVDGFTTRAIILHDAEDAVHSGELDLFHRLIPHYAAVQLPVIPVRAPGSRWVSGHYCDEFAESHGKTLIVRQALGAHLPLAGVGCAIDRRMLERIAQRAHGLPFDPSSLTEDYELGMTIGRLGGRTVMARERGPDGQLIGTRSCFPATLSTSVRQKTRWLTGIAFAGWDRLGWQGGLAQKWMLLHDRRSIFAAVVMLSAYLAMAVTGFFTLLGKGHLYESAPIPASLSSLLILNSLFLFWRLAVRAAFVASVYGLGEAALSVPRSLVGNMIAILSARKAGFGYLRHCLGAPLFWDKTEHLVVPVPRHPRS